MFLEEKKQGEAAPVKVGTLKLSEAIRIGARMRPQGFGSYLGDGKSCALGAAYEGCGAGSWPDVVRSLGSNFLALHDQIVKRNDVLHWTREQIADWLESEGN